LQQKNFGSATKAVGKKIITIDQDACGAVLFFARPKKSTQKKGRPQLGLRLPSLECLPAAGPKTR